jgi:hypothetical protein
LEYFSFGSSLKISIKDNVSGTQTLICAFLLKEASGNHKKGE